MRKYLLAAAAAAAIATPATQASARDHSGYFGLEGGILKAQSTNINFDASGDLTADVRPPISNYYGDYFQQYFDTASPSFRVKHNLGYDIDAIAGYDFGMFRLEAEVAYKRANQDHYTGPSCGGVCFDFLTSKGPPDVRGLRGPRIATGSTQQLNADGNTSALSGMINGLVDFGHDDGFNFSLGGGVGWSDTRFKFSLNDPALAGVNPLINHTFSQGKFAWQLLAEARYPVSPHFDIGLKYRYFDGGKISETYNDLSSGNRIFVDTGHFRTHSLLASVIYTESIVTPTGVEVVIRYPVTE